MSRKVPTILDLNAEGAIDALLAFHRARFGDARMEDEGDESDDEESGDSTDGDDEGKEALGDPGKKALDAMKGKWQTARDELRPFKALGLTPEQITALKAAPAKKADGDEDEKPDLDKIRADAKAEAAREALQGRVEDKIEAKASKFADPEDAVAVLLRSHKIEDFIDGDKVDVDAIAEALTELGEKKPHLLAQGKRFQGGADGGARKAATKERPKTLGDAVAGHYTPEKE